MHKSSLATSQQNRPPLEPALSNRFGSLLPVQILLFPRRHIFRQWLSKIPQDAALSYRVHHWCGALMTHNSKKFGPISTTGHNATMGELVICSHLQNPSIAFTMFSFFPVSFDFGLECRIQLATSIVTLSAGVVEVSHKLTHNAHEMTMR